MLTLEIEMEVRTLKAPYTIRILKKEEPGLKDDYIGDIYNFHGTHLRKLQVCSWGDFAWEAVGQAVEYIQRIEAAGGPCQCQTCLAPPVNDDERTTQLITH